MKPVLVSLAVFLLFSCSPYERGAVFEITTYNAYAFFDGVESGSEYEGFGHSDGYDGEAYKERVRELAILLGRRFDSSDVIILQEIESAAVLSDLLDAGLSAKGFLYYGLAASEDSLSVAFISKMKPDHTAIHSFPGCRPILELVFSPCGESVHIFGVHFRSRLNGGEEERYGQSQHLASLMEGSQSIAVAAGDFNTDPRYGDGSFSVYPDMYSGANAFHVTGDPSRAGQRIYFSPLLDPDAVLEEKGTYFYDGVWYIYDSILLSAEAWDGRGWEFCDVSIRTGREMKDLTGLPFPYDPSLGYGYSDHFPVTVRLIMGQ